MFVSKIKAENLTQEMIDKLLFQGLVDTGEKADCIIVLGSMKAAKYRVPAAAEIYQANRSRKMILCGGKVRDFPDGHYSEAEHMFRAALELGVMEEDIILENSSNNTFENIKFAIIELQKKSALDKIQKVILVTTAYHMRRSLAIARQQFPEHITIIPCPANDTSTRRDNWMHTPIGIDRAKNEAMKIINYVYMGIIPDFEI